MHYTSLHDYVNVIRRNARLIALAVAIVAGVALAHALNQPNRFRTSAVVAFRDLSEDLAPFGIDISATQPLNIRTAAKAQRATSPRIARRVQENLSKPYAIGAIRGAVTAQVNNAQLVVLTATWGGAEFAAEIANEYARQIRFVETRETDERLNAVKESLISALQEARSEGGVGSGIRISVLDGQLSRIQTLLDVSQPVVIVERARVPASRFSPTPVRDAVAGGLAGLVIGIALAFARVALDRRLRTPHDVHNELDAPVIGNVPRSAMGKAGLARDGGQMVREEDFEAFRLLRTNLGYLNPEGPIRSILCTSSLAGEGKSTVSMSLASAAVVAGQRVLLVECDLRRPVFARRLGIPASPGLSDYLAGDAQPPEIVKQVPLATPWTVNPKAPSSGSNGSEPDLGSLYCISAGTPVPNPAELLLGDSFREFMKEVTAAYDLVVIDTTPLLAVADPLELIPVVDAVLICVEVNRTTRDQARAARAMLEHLPERPTAAVLTGLRRKGGETYEYYYGY